MAGDTSFLLRAATRALWLASVDVVTVGLWHPALLAWRMELAAGALLGRRGRARRFDALLAARRTGQADVSFAQGDAPWDVLRRIVPWLRLGPGDTFVDVGAGDGMAAAVLAVLTDARGIAVEPVGVLRASAAEAFAALRLPVTTTADLGEVELAGCRAAFLNWTCVEPPIRAAMEARLVEMPPGARVATVTYPPQRAEWSPVHEEPARFLWGPDRWFVAERR